jgi:hypothetical protein
MKQNRLTGGHFMRTSISILFLLFLVSCNQTKTNRQKSNLRVVVNSNYRQYLWYPSINRQAKDSNYYDSIKNVTITQFDSLKNGKIEVFIFSLLTDNFEQRFDLNKDTIISFDTALYSSFNKTNNLKEFSGLASNLSDTIYIGQKVVGCFGGEIEKLKILKQKDNKFKIEYSNSKNQSSIVIDSLFYKHFEDFLSKAKAIFPDKENGLTFINLSTTSIDTYIRKGNNVLEFPDIYDWKGYDDLKKQIGITIE